MRDDQFYDFDWRAIEQIVGQDTDNQVTQRRNVCHHPSQLRNASGVRQ
jgi:hypothetical protein